MIRIGRKRPYKQIEIGKVKCPCGKPGAYQWNCCANDNRWVALCAECDIKLNEETLRFFKIPGRRALMKKYRAKVRR